MTESANYPWVQQQWQHVLQRYQSAQLPHALLLSGPPGLGKYQFALQLVKTLLCDKNKVVHNNTTISPPCGQCNGCLLFSAGTHPDCRFLSPEAEGKQIPVDAIRTLGHFVSLKSQFAPVQMIVISPAEAMNRHSANSLLKTLEEPQANKYILLVSNQPSRLLPTIRSRCQQLHFSIPDFNESLEWLQSQNAVSGRSKEELQRLLTLAGGAPLLALQFAEQGKLEIYQQLLTSLEKLAKKQTDPLAAAKQWETAGLSYSVKWLYLWVSSLIRLKSGSREVDNCEIDNNAVWREPTLDFLVNKTSSMKLYQFLDQLVETSRIVNTPVNVQLTLESLLIDWCRLTK